MDLLTRVERGCYGSSSHLERTGHKAHFFYPGFDWPVQARSSVSIHGRTPGRTPGRTWGRPPCSLLGTRRVSAWHRQSRWQKGGASVPGPRQLVESAGSPPVPRLALEDWTSGRQLRENCRLEDWRHGQQLLEDWRRGHWRMSTLCQAPASSQTDAIQACVVSGQ